MQELRKKDDDEEVVVVWRGGGEEVRLHQSHQVAHVFYIRLLFISLCAHMDKNQAFRLVESIWLYRKSRQRPIVHYEIRNPMN